MPRRPNVNTGDALADAAARLTPRERDFANAVMAGSTPREAVRIAYNATTESGERGLATNKLSQPEIQAYWRESLSRAGMPVPAAAAHLVDVLNNATTMQLDRNGGEHFHRDYRVVNEALRTYGQITGAIGPRDRDGAGGVTVNIHLPSLPGVDAADLPQIIDVTPTDPPPSP